MFTTAATAAETADGRRQGTFSPPILGIQALTFGRKRDGNKVYWTHIQGYLYETYPGDALMIFDCCFAGHMIRAPHRPDLKEVLAASDSEPTYGFARELLACLSKLLAERRTFTVDELDKCIRRCHPGIYPKPKRVVVRGETTSSIVLHRVAVTESYQPPLKRAAPIVETPPAKPKKPTAGKRRGKSPERRLRSSVLESPDLDADSSLSVAGSIAEEPGLLEQRVFTSINLDVLEDVSSLVDGENGAENGAEKASNVLDGLEFVKVVDLQGQADL